ncbi:MAG: molybdenum cofactor guanylyltransferase [Moraxella sp.]|nr:molybdenum cofactor guanylyltransferase [Moraxella sp.]
MADINAVLILAGGQSSRMGSDKALLTLPSGQTLLDFHLANAHTLGVPILLADNNKRFTHTTPCQTIQDYLPCDDTGKGQGALCAITSGLQYLNQDGFLLVVSCDNLLNINKIAQILTHTTAQVGYLKNNKDYPLLGVYHTSILPDLMAFLTTDNRSVMGFLKQITCQTFDIDDDWQQLANFNTTAEFNHALESFYESFNPSGH